MWEITGMGSTATKGFSSARGKYFFSLSKCFSKRFQLINAAIAVKPAVSNEKMMTPGMCEPATDGYRFTPKPAFSRNHASGKWKMYIA